MSQPVCLIVDDEPAIREYLRVILLNRGIYALEARNADEALRLVERFDGRIDLLVTDVQIPGDMDGVDLAHSLKISHPALPVILISDYVDKTETDGFTFIRKPFLPEAILETIENLLISASKTGREDSQGRQAS